MIGWRFGWVAIMAVTVSCSIIPDVDPPPDTVSDNITAMSRHPLGTKTLFVPDVSGFESVGISPKKVFIECQFKTAFRSEDPQEEAELEEPGFLQRECLQQIGKLMSEKKFILMPAADEYTERWLFRFEESKYCSGHKVSDFLAPCKKDKMWGTLSRFAPGKTFPYSHVLVDGESRFTKGRWQAMDSRPHTDDSMLVILVKGLLIKGRDNL